MHRGYRNIVVAAAGLVALPAISHPNIEARHGRVEATEVANTLRSIADTVDTIKQNQTPQPEPPCNSGEQDRTREFCAQWKAADAASDSAWWAWASGILGIISVVGVFGALGVALSANRLAASTARRQLRAYIHVDRVWLEFDADDTPYLVVRCHNTGQTPAKYFELGAVVKMISTKDEERSSVPTISDVTRWAVIGAGASRIGEIEPENPEGLTLAKFRAPHPGTEFFALGLVRYEDIYGEVWETEFTAFATRYNDREDAGIRMTFANSDIRAFEKVPRRAKGKNEQRWGALWTGRQVGVPSNDGTAPKVPR